ncbi:hypothetical protein ABB37_03712 [Leptomonas pyrrhocoris]|uniref:Uncharacterized protein n=1 Tax=Leptomonas pyrrhocoris TaxID=157538 RepID=A0A0M9G2W7_LEPPY|nr:hypothetical protein ABB37_03712 [Leptomonas pyrrhocoris]KPA81310.1 hypothetical protein ABB37_03712 [Leptomonas pyrrhocoris]|eukprot:XP_015659749.1 hypothetical protein ABB37_03712 [Leptomonas pyrrhocoris]
MLSNNAPNPPEGGAVSYTPSPVPLTSTEESQRAEAQCAPRNKRAEDVVVEAASNDNNDTHHHNNGDGASHAEMDTIVTVSPDTADPFDVRNRSRQRRRTMGEVYPIMKNTIYSDDECEEEIALTAWDCGALFIRYINGIFQYFVRNPKVMGLLFTTAIILLFFKYSQQQVVKVVNAAVKAHPGLEPTDTLRSAVVSFTEELRALERVAQTVGWSYNRDGVLGYDIHTAVNTTFFALVNSFQSTFTSNTRTYVVYALPSATSSPLTAHWGQIGCATESKRNPMCYYVTAGSVASEWVVSSGDSGTTPDDGGNETAAGVYVEQRMPELLNVVSTAKKGSALAATGVWTRPSMTQRIFSDVRVRTISYLLPIAFSTAGYPTALAGVDVSVEQLMDTVNGAATPNMELVVVDNRYNTSEGGQFVYDSFNETLFWATPYGVRNTPVPRVNALAEPVFRNNGITLATNASFYQNGLIYQSLTMMDHWTLIASSPLALSVAEVVASLGSIVKESQSVAKTAASLYRNCEAAANTKSDSMSVEAFAQIEHAFGTQLHSLYMSYALNGASPQGSSSSSSTRNSSSSRSRSSSSASTKESSSLGSTTSSSTSSTTAEPTTTTTTTPTPADSSGIVQSDSVLVKQVISSHARRASTLAASAADSNTTSSSSSSSAAAAVRKWGVCGCTFSSSSSSDTTCFYTDSNQLETIFNGPVLSESPANETKTQDFTTSRRSSFTKHNIDGTNVTAGFWTVPYVSNDTVTGEVFLAVSYVYPSTHNSRGLVSRAVILDTTATWMMQSLKVNQHAGTAALYLIDRRNAGIFLASSTHSSAVREVYPALSTPYSDFNKISAAVYTMAGNSWERSLSFHMDGTLVNYQVVLGQWGVIEVMPGETALQRYLPTPVVEGATDAIRLLPLSQTVELFLYVSGILLLYFLNLLILGCSKLGKK